MKSSTSLTAIHPRRHHSRSASAIASFVASDNASTNASPSTESPIKQSTGFNCGRWRILTIGYTVLSILVFTAYLWHLRFGVNRFFIEHELDQQQRDMPKIIHPASVIVQGAFRPFILKAYSVDSGIPATTEEITACTWAPESGLVYLEEWVERWRGPISLLIITSAAPDTSAHNSISRRLSSLRSSGIFFQSPLASVSIHLLYSPIPLPRQTHNAHINLARLYARTPLVVLFPLGLACLPSHSLYPSLLAAKISHSLIIPRLPWPAEQQQNAPVRPKDRDTGLPFTNESALLIRRSDPLWCTERFFVPNPKEWTECLWQLWLSHPDAVDLDNTVIVSWMAGHWEDDGSKEEHTMPNLLEAQVTLSAVDKRINRRMSSQFRTETCILVARQYLALDVWIETSDDRSLGTSPTVTVQHTLDRREQRKKVAHARAVCDETLKLWGKYLLE